MGCKHFCLLTLLFLFSFQLSAQDILLLKTDGKVVIGDTSQISTPENYQLYVQNGILTERVKVALKESADWSDDSFERTPTLEAVQQSIKNNSHLINIPSAEEVSTKGYELQEMDAKLLEQIEWLWQYMIEMEAENAALRARLEYLENK